MPGPSLARADWVSIALLGCSLGVAVGLFGCGSGASEPPEGTSGGAGTPSTGGAASGGTSAGGSSNRVAPGAVCDRFAAIQCAAEQSCCDAPGRTFAECHATQLSACRDDAYLDTISQNPVTGYSVDAAETAFSEFERLASACDPAIASWASSSAGLRSITLGTIAPGGDCTPPLGSDTPTSAAYAVSCTQGATTACLPALLGWTCTPRGQAGAACFTDLNCIDGLWCDNPNLDVSGDVCKPRKADGSPCLQPNECASLTCQAGTCVAATVQTAYCLAR